MLSQDVACAAIDLELAVRLHLRHSEVDLLNVLLDDLCCLLNLIEIVEALNLPTFILEHSLLKLVHCGLELLGVLEHLLHLIDLGFLPLNLLLQLLDISL